MGKREAPNFQDENGMVAIPDPGPALGREGSSPFSFCLYVRAALRVVVLLERNVLLVVDVLQREVEAAHRRRLLVVVEVVSHRPLFPTQSRSVLCDFFFFFPLLFGAHLARLNECN